MSDAEPVASDSEAPVSEDAGPTSKKVKVDPGFARNLKIIAVVVIVALTATVAVILSTRQKKEPASAAVDLSAAAKIGTAQPVTADPTPAMEKKIKAVQAIEADDAQAAGKSYVPKDPVGATIPVQSQNVPYPGTAPQGPGQSTFQATNSLDPQDQQRREGLKLQLANIFAAQVKTGAGRQTIEASRSSVEQAQQARQTLVEPSAAPAGQRQVVRKALVNALDIIPAELASPLSVGQGRTSFASARIRGGALDGAYLIGTATFTEDEMLELQFNTMKVGSKSYKVDAIVLDEQTASAGMQGSVDRKLLQRYVVPTAMAAAQGFFKALSTVAQSNTIGLGGAVTQSAPAPTKGQAQNAGMAAGLQVLSGDAGKMAGQPIRGTSERGAPIGLLFRTAVEE